MSNVVVEVMSKEHCPLCDDVLIDLKLLRDELAFDVNVIDIYQDEELLEKYQLMIPVILIEGKEIGFGKIAREDLKSAIKVAQS
ncbi:glutaredoxin family protein [Alkalihalobacillus pseudalcaliphilus]|uniref:glutaredoxin family protein n=1 Tax=Alkalihalobacillus pseudalcaliphilus TaxID=79884 RepID=UPI00064D9A8F|nr:glutaredoxin family protein [Alkalihalobacillus pseudalcaliphilus]KMK77487.1 glutaredoxin [Alkalihalobacillus pseudalcaliphilus]